MFAPLVTACEAAAREFDADALSSSEAARALKDLGRVIHLSHAMLTKVAKRVDDTGAYASRGERSAASLVARELGITTREARDTIETAEKLEQLPLVDAAVREGRLSTREAQMIAGAATLNPSAEQELLDAAEQGMVPLRDACIAARAAVADPDTRSARQRTLRTTRTWTDDDGMLAGRFRFVPEIGGPFKAALEAEAQRIFREHRAGKDHEPLDAYAADALARLVLGDPADTDAKPKAKAKGSVLASIHILIDHGALMRGGAVDGEVCEIPGVGPVNVTWVRELLGDAFLTAIIKNGKDITTVANLGRHVPAATQTALIASGRVCQVEGCCQRGYLERDHTFDHAKGGKTTYTNLGWLCYRHHRLKSAGWLLGPRNPVNGKRKLRPPPARAA